jgi:23S rRNA U2552 (ribose-2'-O)-methylase RlmE/FtsJ
MDARNIEKPPPLWKNGWQIRIKTPVWPSEPMVYGPWKGSAPAELLEAKNKILPLEESKRWEIVKKMANPYEMVYTHEDPFFHPSITILKPLSRSYFKMIEMMDILQFFERLPKQQSKIRTAHIAEGPGGFIQAITDLTEKNRKILEKATGMTLKPTDQRVPGWRRASTFLHTHKEVKLHYGVDGTGDIYQLGNQESFLEVVAPGVHLFTADGGFDFSINYETQEQRVFHLVLCSATIGLRCLLEDGSFVLKVFDVFSDSTKILLLLMARCFKEWMLYKPAMSRPCNSERYFIARGFRGLPREIYLLLLEMQEKSRGEEYPLYTRSDLFQEQEKEYFEKHTSANTDEQLKSIFRAIHYSEHQEEWYTTQIHKDFKACRSWCNKYRIPVQITEPLPITQPQ